MASPRRLTPRTSTRRSIEHKCKPDVEWFTTNPGSDLGDWIKKSVPPSELGKEYIKVFQIHHHTHFHSQENRSPTAAENKISFELEREFNERAERWEKQTGIYSSPTKKFLHEDYQIIMTMGQGVVPLILRRLRTRPNDWFWALKHFARKDVAVGKDNFKDAVLAWLEWGVEKGHIPVK